MTCLKVDVYRTYNEAINRTLRKSKHFGKPMRIHYCGDHKGFHSTSKTQGNSIVNPPRNNKFHELSTKA
jgi:hypothetical protein